MKTKLMITTAVAAVMGFSAANVQATLISLTDGTSDTLSATATLSFSSGTSETEAINETLGTVSGTFASSYNVVNGAANPLGGLVFIYQVQLTAGSLNSIALDGFGNIAVDVGYTTGNGAGLPPGNVAPSSVNRSSDGSVITFDFNPDISGVTTYALIIDTSLTTFTQGIGLVQDGDQGNAPIFVPNVPDGGTTAMMLGAGLSGLALLKRKLVA
jgi:VPDSG-CTERM motif